MDSTAEKRYLELMRGFTAEETERLPLEYSLYARNLQALVQSFVESGPRFHIPDLATLNGLSDELRSSMNRQLFLAGPWKPPIVLLPRDRRRIRVARAAALLEATESSASIHRRILQEYFFLTNLLELMLLVQREAATALGGALDESQVAVYRAATAKLVEVFQKTDESYEQTQLSVSEQSLTTV